VCSLAFRPNRVAYGNSPRFRDFLVKRFLPIFLVLLVFAIVGSSRSTGASDWVSLFNGKDLAQKFSDGVVGLQIHTGGGVKMRWKNIYIREE
jgi:hypothetical protein